MKRYYAIGAWVLLAAGLTVAFGGAFAAMWKYHWFPAWNRTQLSFYDRLVEGESYYTHAPLVPLVSVAIAWLLLRHTKVVIRPAPVLGGSLLAGSLLVHLLACLVGVQFVQGFAFIGVVGSLVLCLWGRAALRRLWFPIAILVFMTPLPPMAIAQMNFRLKMLAADWGVGAAIFLGFPVERAGSQILLGDGKEMMVGNACSGLRTLISLVAFGATYAYICRLKGLWRLGLFAMTVPVALVSNCLRIVLLIIVAHFADVATATGWFHDLTGVLVFVLAFLLMFGLEKIVLVVQARRGAPPGVLRVFRYERRPAGDREQTRAMLNAPAGASGAIAVVLILAAAVGVQWVSNRPPPNVNAARIGEKIPTVLQVGSVAMTGQDHELDDRTLTILQTTSYLYRKYEGPGLLPVEVCVTYSQGNRRGSHPPDVCLEGGGSSIVARGRLDVRGLAGEEDLPCSELFIQKGQETECYLYTYLCGKRYTRSWYYQQLAILGNNLLGRNIGGALVRISAPVRANDRAETRRQLAEFMQVFVSHLNKTL